METFWIGHSYNLIYNKPLYKKQSFGSFRTEVGESALFTK